MMALERQARLSNRRRGESEGESDSSSESCEKRPAAMSRELDGLLNKLTQINNEMGGDEGKAKKGGRNVDHFHDLKVQVGDRLHKLKFVRLVVVLSVVRGWF